MRSVLLAAAGLLLATGASARTPPPPQTFPTAKPAFDPKSWQSTMAGPPTQVLVLGAQHLSGWKDFKPEWMPALLDKLAAFRPTVITVENVSGQNCDELRRYPTLYPGVYDTYCAVPELARTATGLDVATAFAQMETTLTSWPADPTPSARRRLTSVMMAAGENVSAFVQWLRLPAAERRAGDGLTKELVERLNLFETRANESFQIGSRLAARVGLERVYMIDDHSADGVQSDDPAFETAIGEIWSGPPDSLLVQHRAMPHAGAAEVLNVFRNINRPEMLRAAISTNFGRAMAHRSGPLWGRQYVGWYEVRNLRMAANIRAAFARTPGARVLSVVGSSHKPYLDAYLEQMHEVRLVDVEAVLR